jgi:hypothetical protein
MKQKQAPRWVLMSTKWSGGGAAPRARGLQVGLRGFGRFGTTDPVRPPRMGDGQAVRARAGSRPESGAGLGRCFLRWIASHLTPPHPTPQHSRHAPGHRSPAPNRGSPAPRISSPRLRVRPRPAPAPRQASAETQRWGPRPPAISPGRRSSQQEERTSR